MKILTLEGFVVVVAAAAAKNDEKRDWVRIQLKFHVSFRIRTGFLGGDKAKRGTVFVNIYSRGKSCRHSLHLEGLGLWKGKAEMCWQAAAGPCGECNGSAQS